MCKIENFQLIQFFKVLYFLNEVIIQVKIVEFSQHVQTLDFSNSIIVQVKSFYVNVARDCLGNDFLESFVL